ncbi:MAG: CsbD family protein [Chloroflexi bacterium]|nr:CsbD family protein [Chloroflexota bacterium]OJW06287.1 MAG: hypothetical protein BGO39_25990 [Chloroflexi bacterium 54-19]
MSEGLGDKVHGKVDELGGKAKQAVGSATGNDELRAEGHADEAKGKTEGFFGKVKDIAEDVVDTAKGAAEKVGEKFDEVTHHGQNPKNTDTTSQTR